jgi:hypothetical protein
MVKRVFGIAAAWVFLSAGAVRAADPEKSSSGEPSAEARRKMATVHEKMAACLRSDRPLSQCREEMVTTCRDMMGEDGCPMMGMGRGGMGPGMMHGPGGMHPASPRSKPEP